MLRSLPGQPAFPGGCCHTVALGASGRAERLGCHLVTQWRERREEGVLDRSPWEDSPRRCSWGSVDGGCWRESSGSGQHGGRKEGPGRWAEAVGGWGLWLKRMGVFGSFRHH